MSLKKKISIIISAAGAITAILLCVLLYRANTVPGVIELPFEKLYWGMTIEEAYEVLDEVGLDDFLQLKHPGMTAKTELWTLTPAEAELLGFKCPKELTPSTYKQYPIHIRFQGQRSSNTIRLIEVSIVFEAPASESVTSLDKLDYTRNKLIQTYGAPTNETKTGWRKMDMPELGESAHPEMFISNVFVGANETLVYYRGAAYVTRLYGGQYTYEMTEQYR